jgi:hypothetical protein
MVVSLICCCVFQATLLCIHPFIFIRDVRGGLSIMCYDMYVYANLLGALI